MDMKKYSTLPIAPELKPHHLIAVYCYTQNAITLRAGKHLFLFSEYIFCM